MRLATATILGAFLTMASITRVGAAEVTQADREAVESLIREQVGMGRSADDQPVSEYSDARRILAGSGADGVGTLVVTQYTIETGLSWQIYLAILEQDTHRTLARGRIGGKSYRSVTIRSVAAGRVRLDALYYGPTDALCCPSLPGSSSIEVRDGELWECWSRVGRASPRAATTP